jgi:hypothetical protein
MFSILFQSAKAAETLKIDNLVLNVGWWPFLFALIKYLFIFMTILFLVAIILIVIRIQGSFKIRIREAVEEAMEAGRLPKTKFQKEWEMIIVKLESATPEDYKKAVVLAGELFNRVLKAANFSGSNMKERLRKIPDSQLEYKEDIIWSHELKEKILKDENFQVDREEAERAVYILERALKEMSVI